MQASPARRESVFDEASRKFLYADALSDVTRRVRRGLLGLCISSIFMAATGAIPSKIDMLGIELSDVDQSTLLVILAAIIFYFLVSFSIYAGTDYLAWRRKWEEHRLDAAKEMDRIHQSGGPEDEYAEYNLSFVMWPYRASETVAYLRRGFDFYLPLFVSIYAMYRLLSLAIG